MKHSFLYNIIVASGLVAAPLMLGGCDDKFEQYNTNPDTPTKATSAMLATGCMRSLWETNKEKKSYMRDEMLCKYIAWTEANDIDIAFNKLGRADFSSMTMLYNINKMVDAATTDRLRNGYEGVGHVIRALKLFDLTLRVGDIPYSQAFQGEDGVIAPAYDSQRDVMLGLLAELETANKLLQEADAISGDIIYGGDMDKWRKAANSLELKLLLNLYRHTDDADLNVKGRMQEIASSRPLFESNDDNLQLVHSDKSGQKPDFYKEGNNYIQYIQITSEVVDSLKALSDRRLFYYAQPTPNAVKDGVSPQAWEAYTGVEATLPEEDIQKAVGEGRISQTNNRYTEDVVGEPSVLLSYAEQNFILAEACARSLISGDAARYYAQGIKAAMRFTADNTPDNADFHHNMPIDDAYIDAYVASAPVALPASLEGKVQRIIEQKYLATFMQQPYNAYYEWRRTGYPVIPVNPLSNRNDPTDKMPLRWMYPQDEYDHNGDNVKAAVQSQYGGTDDWNQVMWLLK